MAKRALAKKRSSRRTGALRASVAARPGVPGGKRDLNRKRRVETLLEAALPLFLTRGIEGVTIDDIVAAAGIAKGSYYRYFDDKAGLVRALFADVSARVLGAFSECASLLAASDTPASLPGAYHVLAARLAAVAVESPGLLRLYLQEARAPAVPARAPVVEIAQRIREDAIALTQVAHAHGLLRPMDPRVSAGAVVGAVENLLFGALSGDDLGDPERVIASLITLVLDGLRRST
jgi:AcrR family transcriptional regulator